MQFIFKQRQQHHGCFSSIIGRTKGRLYIASKTPIAQQHYLLHPNSILNPRFFHQRQTIMMNNGSSSTNNSETTEKLVKILTFNEQQQQDENDDNNNNTNTNNTQILDLCSTHLKQGHLVAFPTETVYGLGANALDTEAVLSIFQAKGRPLTDPVIVHVLDVHHALKLISISEHLVSVYEYLADSFWPGPLTIVTRANDDVIPACVTANTGFVGVRCPEHELARKLLAHSQVAVAAPSANRFGHVSPTRAQHVMDDLADSGFPIYILKSSSEDDQNKTCRVGIESTVVKVQESESDPNAIVLFVLRRGGISVEQLKQSASEFEQSERNIYNLKIQVYVVAKDHSVSNETTQNQSSPGQMLTHYAPDVPAYLLRSTNDTKQRDIESNVSVYDSVIIDFGGHLKHLSSSALAYLDLSATGDVNEARTAVFQALRTSEKIENAKLILLPNLMDLNLEHADSLFDRLFRAASGRYAQVSSSDDQISVLL